MKHGMMKGGMKNMGHMAKCAPDCQMPPTPEMPIRQHAQMAGDPVHAVAGGHQWGASGKVYRGRGSAAKAAAQGRAAYAHGYKGK